MAFSPASSSFPTSKDDVTPPVASDITGVIDVAGWYTYIFSAIQALQDTVGVSSSGDTDSLDYKLTNTSQSDPGHKHTLANGATDVTASATEVNQLDGVSVGGDTSGDILTTDGTETVTNKTIDGDDNTLSDIGTGSLKTKTGADGSVVTGTAGTSGDLAQWNGDGDVVDGPTPPSGTIVGTSDTQTLTNKHFIHPAPQTYTPDAAATQDLDLSAGNEHRVTMPAGNITLTVSNESNGQRFIVSITQDSGGSRTVSWFSTIKWAGGSAPTLTTTANKRDTLGFIVTGADTYDGFVIGSNI